ncbi:hypothetical protein C0991_008602 [Blastosporella zonata]|nr:hypothetical protein C0991_008602 [Blastosporella zonata]
MDSSGPSPKVIKNLKKDITQEEKDEEADLQKAVKDMNLTMKSQKAAHKAALKADSTVQKLSKKETSAKLAAQKADNDQKVALTHLESAQREAQLKRDEDFKLQHQLQDKQTRVDAAMKEQRNHKRGRESRLQALDSGTDPSRANTAASGTGVPGNAPGQYGTGTQAPGTRGGEPGYADHPTTGGTAAGAGLAGAGAAATHGARHDNRTGIASGPGQGDGDIGHRTDAGVGGVDRMGNSGPHSGISGDSGAYAGERGISGRQDPGYGQTGPRTGDHGGPIGNINDNMVRGADTGYPREGPGDYGRTGGTVRGGQASNIESTGGGYGGGGGENLGFRADRMGETGSDHGIRSGARDTGGRSGTHEFVGNSNMQGNVGHTVDHTGGQPIHRGTGIGGRQGVGEDPDFSRDRNYMGYGESFGPGMGQTGDLDAGTRGPIAGSSQGFGEGPMPGGYTTTGATGGLGASKERY